jgi:hypothetical protein
VKKFVSVGKIMSRRRRSPHRPKLATNQSAPPKKTVTEAASQAGLDDSAGKPEKIADQASAVEDGNAHFEMMARKWEERQALFRADWEKADRKERRRFIVEALQYPLKSKHGKAKHP